MTKEENKTPVNSLDHLLKQLQQPTLRRFYHTLPSLTIVDFQIPVPMSCEDHEALIDILMAMKPALTNNQNKPPG